VGCSNAVNLTDGLDGLAISGCVLAMVMFLGVLRTVRYCCWNNSGCHRFTGLLLPAFTPAASTASSPYNPCNPYRNKPPGGTRRSLTLNPQIVTDINPFKKTGLRTMARVYTFPLRWTWRKNLSRRMEKRQSLGV
jgi:hypothetical protein